MPTWSTCLRTRWQTPPFESTSAYTNTHTLTRNGAQLQDLQSWKKQNVKNVYLISVNPRLDIVPRKRWALFPYLCSCGRCDTSEMPNSHRTASAPLAT
jgi:hypothetical protein